MSASGKAFAWFLLYVAFAFTFLVISDLLLLSSLAFLLSLEVAKGFRDCLLCYIGHAKTWLWPD
jgi:hypothetical protein